VKITELAQLIGLFFSTVKVMHYFLLENERATFWATFSQTHLVTLAVCNLCTLQKCTFFNQLERFFLQKILAFCGRFTAAAVIEAVHHPERCMKLPKYCTANHQLALHVFPLKNPPRRLILALVWNLLSAAHTGPAFGLKNGFCPKKFLHQ
jgi:hypothetical protein